MEAVQRVRDALRNVYATWPYRLLTIVSFILFFSFNAFAHNPKLLIANFSFSLLLKLIGGLWPSMSRYAFTVVVFISLLGGIVVALSVFLLVRQVRSGMEVGIIGIVIGLLAPACPSCALSLFALVGVGGFVSILPFKGSELGIVGIIVLVFSIFFLSKKIMTTTCMMKKK